MNTKTPWAFPNVVPTMKKLLRKFVMNQWNIELTWLAMDFTLSDKEIEEALTFISMSNTVENTTAKRNQNHPKHSRDRLLRRFLLPFLSKSGSSLKPSISGTIKALAEVKTSIDSPWTRLSINILSQRRTRESHTGNSIGCELPYRVWLAGMV